MPNDDFMDSLGCQREGRGPSPRLARAPTTRIDSIPLTLYARNRTVKSGALYMFQSELSGDVSGAAASGSAHTFVSFSFCRYPLPNRGRERANPTVGYLPTSAPLLAQHNLKRTYERVQQEGESLLHPLCSPGRGSNQKRSTSTALCRCCTTRRHTRSSAQARTNQRRRQSLAPESRRRLPVCRPLNMGAKQSEALAGCRKAGGGVVDGAG